jgi:hypothetical protein
MKLSCYLHHSWRPLIRPAEATREWMTNSPESFAYRCLPLNIANAHGWECLSPTTFRARWNGGMLAEDVIVECPPGTPPEHRPVGLFGQGVLTFHVQGLFRTEPGWNLWVGGSPNRFKDGLQALTGIVETDWSPYSFTMNWRFTRPNEWVWFDAGEPICFFFPVQRGALEAVDPVFESLTDNPDVEESFAEWSRSRNAFQAAVAANPPKAPADKWQKAYYRGVQPDGSPGPDDHQAKLRLKPFKPTP